MFEIAKSLRSLAVKYNLSTYRLLRLVMNYASDMMDRMKDVEDEASKMQVDDEIEQ